MLSNPHIHSRSWHSRIDGPTFGSDLAEQLRAKHVRPARVDAIARNLKGHNKFGQGRPDLQRLAEYRKTVNEAVTPAQLKKVLAVLLKKAQQGDLAAVKELLDRTVGKATTAPQSQSLDLALPELATTADTVAASSEILRGLNDGRLTADDAVRLAQVIELARRTIETHDLAEQLNDLRRQLESND